MPTDEETNQILPGVSPFTPEEEEQIVNGGLKDLKPADKIAIFELATQSGKIHLSLYSVLNNVFAARWERAKNAEEKERLIDRFEENYLQHKEFVPWYKRIEGSIPAIRRLADRERGDREEKRLSAVLDALKHSTPNYGFDWEGLAARFRSIPEQDYSIPGYDPHKLLYAMFQGEDWQLEGGSERSRVLYEASARQAAMALGYPGSDEGLRVWFALLKRDSRHFKPLTEPSNGWIENLCEASAEFCIVLESRAMEEKSRRSQLPGPKGSRKTTLHRCKLIGASGLTGRELCDYLAKCRTPLPSKKLKSVYGHDWIAWFNADSPSVYKQFSRDRKAFRNLK